MAWRKADSAPVELCWPRRSNPCKMRSAASLETCMASAAGPFSAACRAVAAAGHNRHKAQATKRKAIPAHLPRRACRGRCRRPPASRRSANLLRIMNDDFRAALVNGDAAPDLHTLPLQRFQVAELVFIRCKNHAGKRTASVVRTEIQEGVPAVRGVNAQHLSGYT